MSRARVRARAGAGRRASPRCVESRPVDGIGVARDESRTVDGIGRAGAVARDARARRAGRRAATARRRARGANRDDARRETRSDSSTTRETASDSIRNETKRNETNRARDATRAMATRGMAAASTTRVLPDGRRARGRRTRRRGRAARAAAEVVDVDERGLARALERQGLRLGERVDQGSFAVVYKATSAGMRGGDETSWQGAEGTLHAVKILSATASTVSSRRDFKREATLLTRVNHPGIVKVQHYDETPQPYMVTEFCTSGNLWNALRAEEIKATRFAGASGSPAPVPEEMPLLDFPTLMKDVADALTYLHTAGFAHRDIKTANILLTWSSELNRLQAKLCDFGSAAPVSKMPRRPKRGAVEKALGLGKGWQPVGTMLWMAPEMLRPPIVGEELEGFGGDKSDIYALGVVLWECLEWRVPWMGDGTPTRARVIEEVVDNGSRLRAGDRSSQAVTSLLDGMFKTVPAQRPSASQVSNSLSAIQKRWDGAGMFDYVSQMAITRATEVASLLESTSIDKDTQSVIEKEARAVAGGGGEDEDAVEESATESGQTIEASDLSEAVQSFRPTASAEERGEDELDGTTAKQLTRTEETRIRLTDIDPETWLGEPGTLDSDLLCENLLNMIFPHILDAQFTPEMADEMAKGIEELQSLTQKFNELKRRSRTDPFAALATDSKGREVKRMTSKIERIEVEAQVAAWDKTRTVLREQQKRADEEYSSWRRALRKLG